MVRLAKMVDDNRGSLLIIVWSISLLALFYWLGRERLYRYERSWGILFAPIGFVAFVASVCLMQDRVVRLSLALLTVAMLLIAVPAVYAEEFNEDDAYAFWKDHYPDCIRPDDETACERTNFVQTELERRGWCWVAYDQDMMRPGSSRYLNDYFGMATCPAKSSAATAD